MKIRHPQKILDKIIQLLEKITFKKTPETKLFYILSIRIMKNKKNE